jgi:hypothetical protein
MASKEQTQILDVIKSGRAVMLNVRGKNRIFTMDNVDELPNEADLAMNAPVEQQQATLESIDEQIARLKESKKQLEAVHKGENKAAKEDLEDKTAEAEALEAEATARQAAKEEAAKEEAAPKASAKKEDNK